MENNIEREIWIETGTPPNVGVTGELESCAEVAEDPESPIWINQDYCADPEAVRERFRKGMQERRYHAALANPPERSLAELRKSCGLSQEIVAHRLSLRQTRVSKLERRMDMYLSALRAYIEALGGSLDIVARFPGRAARIKL